MALLKERGESCQDLHRTSVARQGIQTKKYILALYHGETDFHGQIQGIELCLNSFDWYRKPILNLMQSQQQCT